MENQVKEYLQAIDSGKAEEWASHHLSVFRTPSFHTEFCRQLKKRDVKKYIYMVTFTVSPSKWPEITESLENEIEAYIVSQATRQGLNVLEYHYVKELHKSGRPHWHVSVVAGKALKKSLFKYYQQKYGNIDFSRTKGENNQDTLNYISKSNTVTRVV